MATTVTTLRFNRFAEIAARLPAEVGEIVEETIREIETEVKDGMAAAKSGRVYSRGTRVHQASAPGEMPAIDFSNLANSVQVEMDGETAGAVYTNAEYAGHLEYGTVNMEARPYFTTAAEAARPGFERRMRALEGRLG